MADPRELFADMGKHAVGQRLFHTSKQDSFVPDIPTTKDSFVADTSHQPSPFEQFARSGVTQVLSDPFQVKRRMLETPSAGMTFPIAGQAIGAMSPFPLLGRVAGGGLGGFLGSTAESYQRAKALHQPAVSPSTFPEALKEAGVSAAISALPAPQTALEGGKRLVGAIKLGKELGIPGSVEKSAERLSFLKGLQSEARQTPITSGQAIPEREATLMIQHPERQVSLVKNFSGALERIRALISANPVFHREVLTEAQKAGTRDIATAFIPELQLAPSSEGQVLTTGEAGFRKAIFEKLTEQGGLQGVSPEMATFDQIQHLKRTLGNVVGKKLSQFGASFEQAELDALESYGAIREAELATHPELGEEFVRHKDVMEKFRQVKPILSNLSTFEKEIGTGFGETAANQQAFQRLLSPASFLKTQFFADATRFAQSQKMLMGRVLRYGALVPLYTLVSLLRSELFRR